MGTTSSKPHPGGIENRDNGMVSPTSAGIFPLPPSKPSSSSSSLRRREVEIPAKRPSYRDFPSSNEEPNQQRRQRDEEEEEEDEDENDIYSFLPPNHHDDDDDHDDDGYIGTAAHPRRRRGLGSRIRTSLGFRDDVAICTAAFSRLSKGTRLASMLIAGGLGLYAACRLLAGTATRAGDGRTTASKFFSGLADAFGGGPAEDFGYEGRVLTKDQLRGARREARAVVDLLHGYYGGETRAKNMLARSWQEEWKLDLEEYLEREEEDADEAPIWDDDDDSFGDDDDTGQEDDDDRTRTNDNDNDNDNKHRTRRILNNKYVKKAKVIHNHPDNLTPDQIQRRKHHSKQRTTRLIATVARALLDPHRDDFSIGILGDTAAAGIDNCRYDSYDSQLERTLSSVFRAAGMSLRVRNTAQGAQCGDTHENQIWCVQHSVGFDVDVLHYSWSYSEHGGGQAVRENLIRWARQMPRQPMVHRLNVRGKSNTCDGDNLNDVLLNEAYAAFAYNVFCIQTGLHFGGYDYDGELEETGINRFGRQQVGDGYHDTTRYGELETDDDRKHSLGTVFRNWNPGPLGFQMASDAFAYVYSMGVLMALELIERDWNAGLDPRDRWFVKSTSDDVDVESIGTSNIDADADADADADDSAGRRRRLEPQLSLPVDDVPEPLFCDPLYCSTPHPPSCLDYELPAFGAPGPAVRTPTGWTIVRDDNHDWTRGVGTTDVAILKRWDDEHWYRTCSHSDACGGIAASDSSQGELIIELPARDVTVGLIVVCGCCGNNVADDMFLKNGNLEIKWNGKKLNKSKMDVYPNDKCVRVVKAFKEFDKNSDVSKAEQMLLSFHLKKNAKEVKISHVISL